MGRLIKAEFRKILSTKQWWILLVPAAVVALSWAWLFSSLAGTMINDVRQELLGFGLDVDDISWSAIFLTRAINLATIFPMVFGGLALASELGRKTITTSFLTAPNRPMLLGAKAITYVLWGAVFGVVIIAAATLGLVLGSAGEHLVSVPVWLAIAASGLASCVLWTLLGLGVGALIGSPVGTVVVLLVYGIVIGPISDLVLTGFAGGEPNLAGALPNGAANGLTGATAADTVSSEIQSLTAGAPLSDAAVDRIDEAFRLAAGGLGSYGLWASAAIFLGWAVVFFASGIARTQVRDIT